MKNLAYMLLLLAFSASADEAIKNECLSYSFKPDTPEFSNCVLQLSIMAKQREADELAALQARRVAEQRAAQERAYLEQQIYLQQAQMMSDNYKNTVNGYNEVFRNWKFLPVQQSPRVNCNTTPTGWTCQ